MARTSASAFQGSWLKMAGSLGHLMRTGCGDAFLRIRSISVQSLPIGLSGRSRLVIRKGGPWRQVRLAETGDSAVH